MLNWTYEKGHYLGFDDGDLYYRVFETPEGWMWETADSWEGVCDFETAEEAMQDAEKQHTARLELEDRLMVIDLEISLQEIEEILEDILLEDAKIENWKK